MHIRFLKIVYLHGWRFLCAITIPIICFSTQGYADSKLTPPIEFVNSFVNQIADLEQIREKAEKELGSGNPFANCIRTSTSFQLALNAQIAALSDMHLGGQYNDLVSSLVDIDRDYLESYTRMSELCASVLSGDTSKANQAAAELPKITATLDYLGQTIFKASPLIFSTLIDINHPDNQNHVNRLIITTEERTKLLNEMDRLFGNKLNSKDQNYAIGTISVIEGYLAKKGYKASDEP